MGDVLDVLLVVPGDITRLFGPLKLQLVLLQNPLLDQVSAGLVDRMGDVRIELVGGSFDIVHVLGPSQPPTALVAVVAAHVVFRAAAAAPGRHFAAGHGDKGPVGPFDDLQVPDHKGVVEGD